STSSVLYRGTDNDIHELALNQGPFSWAWTVSDLSAGKGGGPAASDPFGYIRGDAQNTVVYRNTSNHIIELSGAGWVANDLTAQKGAPNATGSPSAYLRSDAVSSIVFLAADGHVHELYMSQSGFWNQGDLGQ